jgi:translocation and assembly module TamB
LSVTLVISLLVALLAALWFWSGQANSLGEALQWSQRWLPQGHSLSVRGAKGSLRAGGRIAELRWQFGERSVTALDVRLAWQAMRLLDRQLVIDQLRVGELLLQLPSQDTPTQLPPDLMLPVQVDAQLQVDALSWQSTETPMATALVGHYRFDGAQHSMAITQAQWAEGNYQGEMQLGARSPLPLNIAARGRINTRAPGKGAPLTLDAQATVTGPLGGADPILAVMASVQGRSNDAMQASVQAQWQPWTMQPFDQLDARFSKLNLAALWPQAPITQVSGELTISPLATASRSTAPAWQARGIASNALPGSWDRQRLPLSSLQLDFSHSQGSWHIETLKAAVEGGQVHAQGQLSSATSGSPMSRWEGRAEVQNLNPAALHSQMAPARLNGTLWARTEDQGLAFGADLQPAVPAPRASSPPARPSSARGPTTLPALIQGLQLQRLHTQGVWSAPWLRLSALEASTTDATLSGPISINTQVLSGEGKLSLHLPGGKASAQGALADTSGQGNLQITLTDINAAHRWLAMLPALAGPITSPPLQGEATLRLSWQGGWRQWAAGGASTTGKLAAVAPSQLDAQLHIPRLGVAATPSQSTWWAKDAGISLRGTPGALNTAVQGQLHIGEQVLQMNSAALWTRRTMGDWQAQLAPTTLALLSGTPGKPWTLRSEQPLPLRLLGDWQNFSLTADPGQAVLSGPPGGSLAVQWQPVRWQRAGRKNTLSTDGRVVGIPLAWLEYLAQSRAASSTLRGDLLLDGAWHLNWADTLSAQLSLARSQGDLRLQTGEKEAGVDAGIRTARLTLDIADEQARARLDWDSLRAGQLQADLRSSLTHDAEGLHWRPQAPLSGQIQAQLPQLGVWSMLAPPGWRVRGTLDTKLTVSGTRTQPLWHGQLNADQLALRSVAEGIEFSQGELRALLDGQGMNIQHFRLLGAGGTSGGELVATGQARWGQDPASGTLDAGPRVTLDAQARQLKVSARADRRLVVSGQLRLDLTPQQLNARGTVRADQALFILPEEDTPSLGRDVVVRQQPGAPGNPAATGSVPAIAAPNVPQNFTTDIDLNLDAGDDFLVRGRGLNTRLAGSVRLLRAPHEQAPRLTGELRTVGGTYKAYGQQLDIEQGVLRFSGAYDNPGLNILALRPHLVVTVGVQVTGTVLSPRVRLYADPELPEAEKLAWLVLGRGAASGGAEAAVLQQAAMALLGGSGRPLAGGLAEALGLDELSFRGATAGDTGTATGATVTLGKRLSRDFYVAFERSLAGTVGTVYIFYNLSRRLTLRAQTGEQSALDVIMTLPYD